MKLLTPIEANNADRVIQAAKETIDPKLALLPTQLKPVQLDATKSVIDFDDTVAAIQSNCQAIATACADSTSNDVLNVAVMTVEPIEACGVFKVQPTIAAFKRVIATYDELVNAVIAYFMDRPDDDAFMAIGKALAG